MTARILDCTPAEYLRDPCARPSLSASAAHTLVTRSSLHCWAEHPRLGDLPQKPTDATDEGSIIHALLLGAGADLDVISADNYRTKAAQELRDAAIGAGRVPVLERKYEQYLRVADEIRERLWKEHKIAFEGRSEMPIEWDDGGVLCRSMLDHVYIDDGVIFDLKKTVSADARSIEAAAYRYGYDIQAVAYSRALAALKPELAGRIDFRFVFVELEPPFAVVAPRPDGTLLEIGERRWDRAREIWRRCLERDEWPGYEQQWLSAPGWAISQEEFADGSTSL